MIELQYSRKAQSEFIGIFNYGLVNYGLKHAESYRDRLKLTLSLICANPELGRSVPQFGEGIRRLEHESHIIFYKRLKNVILVVRFLHKSSDVDAHLGLYE